MRISKPALKLRGQGLMLPARAGLGIAHSFAW